MAERWGSGSRRESSAGRRRRDGSGTGIASSSAFVYGCCGSLNTASVGPVSHDPAQVHHGHAMADVPDHRQVVRDEQDREAEVALELGEQVQHLRLHGHVQRRDRLVGHDERGEGASAAAMPTRCR